MGVLGRASTGVFVYGHPLSYIDISCQSAWGQTARNPTAFFFAFLGKAPYNKTTSVPLDTQTDAGGEFLVSDSLGAGPTVVREAIFIIFDLKDGYGINGRFLVCPMSSEVHPGILKGSMAIGELCRELTTRDSFPGPLILGEQGPW